MLSEDIETLFKDAIRAAPTGYIPTWVAALVGPLSWSMRCRFRLQSGDAPYLTQYLIEAIVVGHRAALLGMPIVGIEAPYELTEAEVREVLKWLDEAVAEVGNETTTDSG